ncbi:hypothetical protein ACSQ67_005001 [Phaseolus vulgaris]
MANRHSRKSIKLFGRLIGAENVEDLQRTKSGLHILILELVHANIYGPMELITHSEKKHLLCSFNDYNCKGSIYFLFENSEVMEYFKTYKLNCPPTRIEYFSSEEVDGNRRRSGKEAYYVSDFNTPREEFDRGDGTNEVTHAEATKFEEQLTLLMKEVESLDKRERDLELEVEKQTHEAKHLTSKSIELNDEILKLELLKEENVNGLDLAIENVKDYASRVTKMMCEVQFVKDWMREKNEEVKDLRDNVDYLKELLNKKEEEELLLRENLWKLEAELLSSHFLSFNPYFFSDPLLPFLRSSFQVSLVTVDFLSTVFLIIFHHFNFKLLRFRESFQLWIRSDQLCLLRNSASPGFFFDSFFSFSAVAQGSCNFAFGASQILKRRVEGKLKPYLRPNCVKIFHS